LIQACITSADRFIYNLHLFATREFMWTDPVKKKTYDLDKLYHAFPKNLIAKSHGTNTHMLQQCGYVLKANGWYNFLFFSIKTSDHLRRKKAPLV
jgi:hypothetical protein